MFQVTLQATFQGRPEGPEWAAAFQKKVMWPALFPIGADVIPTNEMCGFIDGAFEIESYMWFECENEIICTLKPHNNYDFKCDLDTFVSRLQKAGWALG